MNRRFLLRALVSAAGLGALTPSLMAKTKPLPTAQPLVEVWKDPNCGNKKDPYDVLLIEADGSSRVYQSYRN